MRYDDPYFYIQPEQAKQIEDVLQYLYQQKKPELASVVCDLMRMSENWYGRLQQLKEAVETPAEAGDA